MFRSIAKWYISRAIDCDQAAPAWVRRLVAHDPVLEQFNDQSLHLAARLRAAEFVTADDVGASVNCDVDAPVRVATARPKRAAVRLAILAVGLAAIVFFAVVPIFNQTSEDGRVFTPELAKVDSGSDSLAGSAPDAIDTQRLRELIASGRTLVQSLNQQGASSAAQAVDYDQFAAFADLEIKQVIQPVSDLGSSYGELLTQFDQHVEAENQRIISDGITAWNFFVHKLPQSAASVAGL